MGYYENILQKKPLKQYGETAVLRKRYFFSLFCSKHICFGMLFDFIGQCKNLRLSLQM